MNLFDLCAQLPHINKPIICFRADVYSALFFSQWLAYYKRQCAVIDIEIQSPDTAESSFEDIERMLSTTFLGQSYWYWLKDITGESAAVAKWNKLLARYTGPHKILLYSKTGLLKEVEHALYIDLPKGIDASFYQKLYELFYPTIPVDPRFTHAIFHKYQQISLDQACLLMQYHMNLGRRSDEFIAQWTDSIISPDKSLFLLSQHFFAQEETQFLALYKQCSIEYGPEFWTVYFAEQLWQALIFVTASKSNSPQEARKLVNRLPFSFMNKDWKKYNTIFLQQAYHALYLVEYAIKNSIPGHHLELWMHKFFLKSF